MIGLCFPFPILLPNPVRCVEDLFMSYLERSTGCAENGHIT